MQGPIACNRPLNAFPGKKFPAAETAPAMVPGAEKPMLCARRKMVRRKPLDAVDFREKCNNLRKKRVLSTNAGEYASLQKEKRKMMEKSLF